MSAVALALTGGLLSASAPLASAAPGAPRTATVAAHKADAVPVAVLAADGGKGKGTNWDAPATPVPGLENVFPEWVGWGKWVGIGVGILGMIACGIMMMAGRKNRSHMAAEGANGLLWVLGGVTVVSMAAGVIPMVMGA